MSFACSRLKETDFDFVAEYSFTGTETSPKLIVPDAMACAGIVLPLSQMVAEHIIDWVARRGPTLLAGHPAGGAN